MDKSIEAVAEYILAIPKFAKKIGHDNLRLLMKELGNPENAYKVIHVAGTNGKGSVTTIMSEILMAGGLTVGTFTSPHLVKMNERISINGVDINDDDFVRMYELVMEASQKLMDKGMPHPSFFEFVFAMAAVYFKEKNIDIAVFETGMGGRLDATNIVTPIVSVITSIGLDHMQYLGDTISQIAYEKAGIIKHEIPVVSNTGNKEADNIISTYAKNINSDYYNVENTEVIINEISAKGIDFSLLNEYYKYYSLRLDTKAVYQADNAATAILALYIAIEKSKLLKLDKEFEVAVREGLEAFYWPGRLEEIMPRVFIDGAHNLDAIERFVETVKRYAGDNQINKIKIFFAVSSDKDYESMLEYMMNNLEVTAYYVTEYDSARTLNADKVIEILSKGIKEDISLIRNPDAKELLQTAIKDLAEDEALFCVGSLYLVGEIKRMILC